MKLTGDELSSLVLLLSAFPVRPSADAVWKCGYFTENRSGKQKGNKKLVKNKTDHSSALVMKVQDQEQKRKDKTF